MQAVFNFQDKKLLSVVVKVCKTLIIVSEGILLVLLLLSGLHNVGAEMNLSAPNITLLLSHHLHPPLFCLKINGCKNNSVVLLHTAAAN